MPCGSVALVWGVFWKTGPGKCKGTERSDQRERIGAQSVQAMGVLKTLVPSEEWGLSV